MSPWALVSATHALFGEKASDHHSVRVASPVSPCSRVVRLTPSVGLWLAANRSSVCLQCAANAKESAKADHVGTATLLRSTLF